MIRVKSSRKLGSLETDVRRIIPGVEVLEMSLPGQFVIYCVGGKELRESDAIALRNLHGITSAELVTPRERPVSDQWRFSEPGPE